MEKSKQCERQEISSWSCCDVNDLYENIAKVGSGTYGEVTKARLKSNPSQLVALKKIKDASETEGFPITALREINILQQCDHPNIVKLLNVVASKSKNQTYRDNKSYTYLVFEYMDHELLGYIEMCSFNPSQVKCILKQILEGLAYLHSKNIVHRDIKSANILVNNRGEVKIADFGLSKAMNPNLSGKLTQRVVTRWYRAPELLLGSKNYTDKIDIWALGCVFAELLVGRSQALFPAQKTPDQFELICEKCGIPDEGQWPEYKSLPFYNKMAPRRNYTRVLTQFMCRQRANMDPFALDLLEKMLCFNPDDRITAKEALSHPYFQSFPLPCAPFELPKIEQDCHTFIINNKRKNNYAENNYKNNLPYVNQKLSYKNRNMQPQPQIQPQAQKPNLHNVHPINTQPPLCQYNNYCNCNQYTHIENVNNINVNLFLPAQNPLMSQVNFYPSNFPQQVPSFNPSMGFEGLNNNFFVPQHIPNPQSQINPMDLGLIWKAKNVVPVTNQNLMPEINPNSTTYNRYDLNYPYCSSQYQQQTQYSNQSNKYQYQQDPNLYNMPPLRKDQISSFENPYFSAQDQLMRGNAQTLKRRANNNIEEFEMMQKKHQQQFFGFCQQNN